LIEECVAQIVLHRSGYDPDFRAKKFEIDVDGLTNLVVGNTLATLLTPPPVFFIFVFF